jgi:anti-sigma factor RsiW
MPGCLNEKTLEGFARGDLPKPQMAETEAHLHGCRRCAEALAEMSGDNELVREIRDLGAVRKEIAPALTALHEIEDRLTSTLFPC